MSTVRVTTTAATVLRHTVELSAKVDAETVWERQARGLDEHEGGGWWLDEQQSAAVRAALLEVEPCSEGRRHSPHDYPTRDGDPEWLAPPARHCPGR